MPNIAILYQPTAAHPMILTQEHVDLIAAHNRSGEVRWYRTEEEVLADPFDAEILFGWGRETPDDACSVMPNLKWVQSVSAGVEGLSKLKVMEKEGMILSKMKGIHGYVMAETCLAFILNFLRSLPLIQVRQRAHLWKKPELSDLRECKDTTVGILGMGDIGSRVALLCKLLGMTVLGCRRTAVPMENIDRMYTLDQLDEMLPKCDFVVDLVPDTPASEKMVDKAFFEKMRNDAVFINIGRGATVDTQALIEALQSGVIAGAAIDAVTPEPLEEDSPLWDMENVILTPHCSADSPNYFDRAVQVLINNLEAYQDGKPVPTAVTL